MRKLPSDAPGGSRKVVNLLIVSVSLKVGRTFPSGSEYPSEWPRPSGAPVLGEVRVGRKSHHRQEAPQLLLPSKKLEEEEEEKRSIDTSPVSQWRILELSTVS